MEKEKEGSKDKYQMSIFLYPSTRSPHSCSSAPPPLYFCIKPWLSSLQTWWMGLISPFQKSPITTPITTPRSFLHGLITPNSRFVTLKKLHNRTPSIYEQLGFNVYFRRHLSQRPCRIRIDYEWSNIENFREFCQGWAHSVTFCCSWDESQKKIHVERLEIVSDIDNRLNI